MEKNADHPFLRPLWRRALLVAFCAAWSVFEFANDSPTWGMIVGALAVYGAWSYLIAYKPAPEPAPPTEEP